MLQLVFLGCSFCQDDCPKSATMLPFASQLLSQLLKARGKLIDSITAQALCSDSRSTWGTTQAQVSMDPALDASKAAPSTSSVLVQPACANKDNIKEKQREIYKEKIILHSRLGKAQGFAFITPLPMQIFLLHIHP